MPKTTKIHNNSISAVAIDAYYIFQGIGAGGSLCLLPSRDVVGGDRDVDLTNRAVKSNAMSSLYDCLSGDMWCRETDLGDLKELRRELLDSWLVFKEAAVIQ